MLFYRSWGKELYSNKEDEAELKKLRQEEAKGDIKTFLENYQAELEQIKAEKRAKEKQIEGQDGERTLVSWKDRILGNRYEQHLT